MALAITKPVPCPYCGNEMNNFSINNTTHKIDFRCKCGKIVSLSEDEYKKMLRTGKLTKSSN